MADRLCELRQKLRRTANHAIAVKRLHDVGVLDLGDVGNTLAAAKNTAAYGPQASLVIQGGRKYPSLPALTDERGTLTYRQVDEMSSALAHGLIGLGVTEGSVAAVLCRDHRGLIVAMAAYGKIGARYVLMNTGFAKPQFAEVCKREGIKAVLYDSEFSDLIDALPADLTRVLTWVDADSTADVQTIDDVIAANSSAPLPAPSKPGSSVVLTSGTTGLPKGAPRSKVSPLATAEFVDRIPYPRGGTMVVVSPIFHGTGLVNYLIGAALGNHIVTTRRFTPEATLRLIADHKADMLVAVPTMLHRMAELGSDVLSTYDTSSLKVIFSAGSALSPELSNRVQDAFGDVLYNLYASTECGVGTVATPAELRSAPGTAGRCPVTSEVVLFDEHDQRIRGVGKRGRIFIRSEARFQGYTDGRNKQIIDGYMSSGDIGHFDEDGLLFVDGRDDDMIVSGGENVFPQEIEDLLAERTDISEVAVVGVDDADFGKRLRAFVVSVPGASQDAEEIKRHVKENLARHKVPRDVVFVEELPRNATGKLLRRVLVDMDVDS